MVVVEKDEAVDSPWSSCVGVLICVGDRHNGAGEEPLSNRTKNWFNSFTHSRLPSAGIGASDVF